MTELQGLTWAALHNYAHQWAGTARGDAARAEITAREARGTLSQATLDTLAFDTSGPSGATFNRCKCEGCQDLAARDHAARAARAESADVYGGTIPSIVRVRETIRHGDYVSRLTVGGSTLADAVASSLGVSPYNHAGAPHIAGGDLQARIVADLTATGHAEFGWADYDVVA